MRTESEDHLQPGTQKSEVHGFRLHPDLPKKQLHFNSSWLNTWGLKAQGTLDWVLEPSMPTALIRTLVSVLTMGAAS